MITIPEYKNTHWGYHLMLDCSGCERIDSKANIHTFVKELVPHIGMIPHGEPTIEYLLEGDPKQGYSLMQLITTSNITGHFMELDGTAYFDVFSCKTFSPDEAVAMVKKYFNPKRIRVNFLTRHAD
jgi:S-adenosylmethionine/arginine decarboxylase-like enzyme